MRRSKISIRFGSVILVTIMIVISFLGLTMDRMFSNFYRAELRTEVSELADHFSLMSETPEMLSEEVLLQFTGFSTISALLVSEQGDILAKSGPYDFANTSFILPDDRQRLFHGQTIELEYTDSDKQQMLIAGRPIMGADGTIQSAVYVLSSTEHLEESIQAVRKVLLLAGIGAFFIAIGMTWVTANLLSRPLVVMEHATRKIAAGELETRLAFKRDDEIGALSDSINHLAIELQRYRDNRQELFANISHELRTPITYLEGYTEVLKKRLFETDEERNHYLDIIHEESRRLQYLVNDLFDLAKMEEGQVQLTLDWIQLGEIGQQSLDAIRLKASAKQLDIHSNIHQPLPLMYGDPIRIQQIIVNLLENAVRYTEVGSITLQISQVGHQLLLAVEDTGIGIPEAEIPYIFERFHRVEKSRSRQFGGTGLGLSITQKLVELHHGELRVCSKVGQGTRMEIRFTLKPQGEQA